MDKRKPIPIKVKLEVVLAQNGKCNHCGENLGLLVGINFDHRPALWSRPINASGTDTIPAANDPSAIEAVHVDCHKVRTHGTAATTLGSDSHERAKSKRLTAAEEDFRRRMLAKSGQGEAVPKQRGKLKGRPFPKRRKEA